MSGPINPTTLTFTEPQTNADGSELKDLKEYWVFISSSQTDPWTGTPIAIVPAQNPNPAAGSVVTLGTGQALAAVPPGQYYATIKAVDMTGNASVAATPIPFVVGDTVAPSPPTNLVAH